MKRSSDAIATELQRDLGPEYLSTKPGSGDQIYIEGHRVIDLANEIFGFDGWSSEILKMETVISQENHGRFLVVVQCITRVTLVREGNSNDGIGTGKAENSPSRAMALDKARKEAQTDALKRALRMFGKSLGNCVYDKEFKMHVRKVKTVKREFDPSDLRRPKNIVSPKAAVNDDDIELDIGSSQFS